MILVTGSSGFLGKQVLTSCAADGALGLSRSRVAFDKEIQCDLSDSASVQAAARQLCTRGPFTAIVHTAAVTPWTANPEYSHDITLAKAVLGLAQQLKIPRIIFISGWNVYDMTQNLPPYAETTPLHATDSYGASKIMVESFFQDHAGVIEVIILRTASVYGPGQFSPGLVSNITKNALSKGKIVLNSVKTRRDYFYIDDFIDALKIVLAQPLGKGRIFNVGSGSSVSVEEVAQLVGTICGSVLRDSIDIKYATQIAESDIQDNCLDISRLKSIGFTPKTSLEVGLRQYIKWRSNENIL